MSLTPAQLVAPQLVTNAQTTVYTSTGLKTRIDKMSFTNTTGSAATITVNLVPSAGAAASSNTITSAKSVNAGETWNCPDVVGHVLKSGDFISILGGTNNALTVMAAGVQIT